jgi:broad specificity phosphatase PhoE
MILYLIRHGQTASNRDGLGLGRDDVPLTEEGVRQAAALGSRLAEEPLDRILVSPLRRAVRTAELVAGERGIALEVRDELIELDVGLTEGLPFPEIRERYGDFLSQWQSDDCASVRMPGGESLDDVASRVRPLLAELREAPEQALAVVSHNFVLRVMLCELLTAPARQFRAMPLGLASVTTVILERGRVNVRSLNDRCHLEMLESSSRSG